jgi:eukaryotic-like serine/threonine-protein kinase
VQSGEPTEPSELPAELQNHPRYRIVEQIGKGGMGDVFRAEHKLMNRSVALNLINSQLVKHPQGVKRFQREVQAAARLTHPNIVTAFDAEQAGDVHFLAMEFVEGTDLATVVQGRGPMPVGEACECTRQVADGLQPAHAQLKV